MNQENEIILCTTCGLPLDREFAKDKKGERYCKCPFEVNEKQLREMRNEAYRNIPHNYVGKYKDGIENKIFFDTNKRSLNR